MQIYIVSSRLLMIPSSMWMVISIYPAGEEGASRGRGGVRGLGGEALGHGGSAQGGLPTRSGSRDLMIHLYSVSSMRPLVCVSFLQLPLLLH